MLLQNANTPVSQLSTKTSKLGFQNLVGVTPVCSKRSKYFRTLRHSWLSYKVQKIYLMKNKFIRNVAPLSYRSIMAQIDEQQHQCSQSHDGIDPGEINHDGQIQDETNNCCMPGEILECWSEKSHLFQKW